MTYFDCKKCAHYGDDDDICSDCSVFRELEGCCCHINPPCSFCVNLLYEEKTSVKMCDYNNHLCGHRSIP